jgi:flagellar hook-basal body complex protein FliE
MSVAGVHGAIPVAAPESLSVGGASAAPKDSTFSTLINDLLGNVQEKQRMMNQDVTNLALGKADNLHQVVVNVAEADLMFRMLMEVRDRLITSYQEIMRMQI